MIDSLMLALGDAWMLITQVFVICFGVFVIHTLATLELNHNAQSLGDVVNDLYVSCYYASGACGALLMGYVYELFGWTAFLVMLLCVGMTGVLCIWLYSHQWATGR